MKIIKYYLLIFLSFFYLSSVNSSEIDIYEKIDLIGPEKRQELLADLKNRTGIDVVRVEIRRVDFLKDIAYLRIFYYEND